MPGANPNLGSSPMRTGPSPTGPALSPTGYPYSPITQGTIAGTAADLYVPGAGTNKTNQTTKIKTSSDSTERKTKVPGVTAVNADTPSEIVITASGEKSKSSNLDPRQNVLNKYRSYTYNFTLAALEAYDLENPDRYQNSELSYVVLKTGGKGTTGISLPADIISKTQDQKKSLQTDPNAEYVELAATQKSLDQLNQASSLINNFNKKSPGRFDMFIDNVEIETTMAFTEKAGYTQPSGISFEITEPYSINGFLEALHVSAVAAGYPTYASASFVLKVEFIGYPDDQDIPTPVLIDPWATRFFVFSFSEVQVEATERGTRYRCKGGAYEQQKTLGNADIIKQPVSMTGKTVKELLDDLFKKINKQIVDADESSKKNSTKKHDVYEISFPALTSEGVFTDGKSEVNKIADSVFSESLKSNRLYKFLDPATSPTGEDLRETQVQFADGRLIHEGISAIIRDSEYTKNILKEIDKSVDANGFIDYFVVRVAAIPSKVIDTVSKRPFMTYRYLVCPFKVHYTRIPDYTGVPFDVSKLKKLCWREYNYLYTGKNIDIINFKLDFPLLFVDAMPKGNANNDNPAARDGAARSNDLDIKSSGTSVKDLQADQNNGGTRGIDVRATGLQPVSGGAGLPQDDPYGVMARNMHAAIVNSAASLAMAELEILGDPFFLVTGGVGNYTPKIKSTGITENGEAAYITGDVLVNLNFRNPVDIGTFEQGGLVYFQEEKVPFSGVYRVSKARSSFREGMFKQTLTMQRIPSQIDSDSKITIGKLADRQEETPAKGEQSVADTTQGTVVKHTVLGSVAIPPMSVAPFAEISKTDISTLLANSIVGPKFPNPLASVSAAIDTTSVAAKFSPLSKYIKG
jgi:hypothetical protein